MKSRAGELLNRPLFAGLSFIEAGDQSTDYCDVIANASFTCFPGKKYFPRGPMQITWYCEHSNTY